MASVAEFDLRSAVVRLERREQVRSGISREEARKAVARMAGLLPGTLERIARNRVKDPRSNVRTRVCTLMAREWEAEIKALTHELAILRRLGTAVTDYEIAKVETSLGEARQHLQQLRSV